MTIQAPRDRNASFEPQYVRKSQSRLTQMDDQILALYAKGLSTRDIVDAFKEMYDADISATLVSKVTELVIEQVHEWQNQPLFPFTNAKKQKGLPDWEGLSIYWRSGRPL